MFQLILKGGAKPINHLADSEILTQLEIMRKRIVKVLCGGAVIHARLARQPGTGKASDGGAVSREV